MKKPVVGVEKGFTIVELMIATTVLSVVLVLASVMMVSIGKLYQKGINQSRVQGAARTITDDVSANLQLSNSLRTASDGERAAYCIGSIRYTYIIGHQLGSGQDVAGPDKAKPVLWRDKTPPAGCSTDNLDASGTELIPSNSRLLAFDVSGASPYQIQVGIAYGDFDLLNVNQTNPVWNMDVRCKGDIGGQFCATATLSTVATPRL